MPDYYADPDARSNFVPLCVGLVLGLAVGGGIGILVGVKLALGAL